MFLLLVTTFLIKAVPLMDKLLLKSVSHTVNYCHKYQNVEQENPLDTTFT